MTDHCVHELTVAMTAFTRTVQSEANQHSSMDRGGTREARTPAEELLTVGGHWEKENPCLFWYGPWYVAHIPVDGPTLLHTQTALIALREL